MLVGQLRRRKDNYSVTRQRPANHGRNHKALNVFDFAVMVAYCRGIAEKQLI
jgi:hypothetical protein